MTNLKIEYNGIKLELSGLGPYKTEKALLAAFAHMEGGSFTETYVSDEIRKSIANMKKDKEYAPAVNGVRIIDDIKHYKCSYSCPCGERGTRYIKEDTVITSCHKCKTTLNVAPAVGIMIGADLRSPENIEPQHDNEFNYYVAY